MEYLFIESPTGGGGGTGRRSHSLHEERSCCSNTKASLCYLRLAPCPSPALARQSHQALRLLRVRRERGRQEGHLRGIDAKDIRALLTGRRGEEEGEEGGGGTGFREREINISLDFIVLI